MSVLVICSLVSVHGMVLVNYRVAGGISLHDQKFVFRGIREKVSHHRRKTLNANKPSRFQRVFVDFCVRRADNGKVPAFRSGFERNVVVKLGAGRGGSKIHVRRGGRSVFELALLIVHVLFRSGIGVVRRASQVRHLVVTHVNTRFHRKPRVRQPSGSLRTLWSGVTLISLIALTTSRSSQTLRTLQLSRPTQSGISLVPFRSL